MSDLDDLDNKFQERQAWLESLKHDAQRVYQVLYENIYENHRRLLGSVSSEERSRAHSIRTVEKEFNLQPGTFTPITKPNSTESFI